MLMESLTQSIKGSWNAEEVISIFIVIDLWKKSDFYSLMDVALKFLDQVFFSDHLIFFSPSPFFLLRFINMLCTLSPCRSVV